MAAIEKSQIDGAGLSEEVGLSSQPHKPPYNFDGSGGPGPKYLRTEQLLNRQSGSLLDRMIVKLAEKLIGIEAINAICLEAGTPWPSSEVMIQHIFDSLDVKWQISNPQMFDKIKDRQVVFVANHPYGMPDAFAVNSMLEKYRPNFRLFANSFLTCADSITHKLLFVDPFMQEKNRAMNRRSMGKALRHLKEGGDLALFPGRICSHLKWGKSVVQDGEWTDQVKIFMEAGKADLVPIHVSGRNSWRFQAAGLLHPKLRTLLILREFLRGGHNITFTLGEPLPLESLLKASRVAPAGQIARALTYSADPAYSAKQRRLEGMPVQVNSANRVANRSSEKIAVASAANASNSVAKTLANYPVLVEHGKLRVHNVEHGLPQALIEEVAKVRFDAYSGEASVASPAELLDRYDEIYSHLILWDKEAGRIAGSYRYLIPSRIEGGVDPTDLVTSSIFNFKDSFIDILPKALELGRAAISEEYQRSYAPLMMMWRAVMDILRQDKSIKYLIGPVTISRKFSPLSRKILQTYLDTKSASKSLAGSAVPYHAFEAELPPQVDPASLVEDTKTLTDIGCVIEALEYGKRKLPVLYRQYDNIGLRYVATGEWPELDYAMASLAVLDLSDARRDFIARYLGKDNVESFFEGR